MMELPYDSMYLYLLAIVVVAVATLYYYFTSAFSYWKDRGVPYLEPEPFFGNVRATTLGKTQFSKLFQKFYQELEGHDFGGIFQFSSPALVIRDPDLIRQILVKDFVHFHDRAIIDNEDGDPLTAHLFNLQGSRWRNLRVKLTPTFTSGKMKMMFNVLRECGEELAKYLQETEGQEVEIKEVASKFTTDVIGTCAFGIQFNSLKDPDSEFRTMGRKVLAPDFIGNLKRMCLIFLPSLASVLKFTFVPADVTEFFINAVRETVEFREKNHVTRNDFMDLLIELKNKGVVKSEREPEETSLNVERQPDLEHQSSDVEPLTNNLLAAQAFVFFIAGFETSSSTISFCLYELALNPDIQEKLRAEIRAGLQKSDGKLTYETIHGMDYLNKVVTETLRKYPPVGNLLRNCTKSYSIPGTDVVIEKGVRVFIPVYAIHHDPAHYPDPEQFRPERFDEDEKRTRHNYTYLPFGEGPRVCIGQRFGLMQTKVGLASILADYKVCVTDKTSIPLVINPKTLILSATGGIWLKLQAI